MTQAVLKTSANDSGSFKYGHEVELFGARLERFGIKWRIWIIEEFNQNQTNPIKLERGADRYG